MPALPSTQISADRNFLPGGRWVLRPNLLPCALACRSTPPSPALGSSPIELSEDAHHPGTGAFPARRGGVDALLMQEQVDAEGVDLRQEAHKVL